MKPNIALCWFSDLELIRVTTIWLALPACVQSHSSKGNKWGSLASWVFLWFSSLRKFNKTQIKAVLGRLAASCGALRLRASLRLDHVKLRPSRSVVRWLAPKPFTFFFTLLHPPSSDFGFNPTYVFLTFFRTFVLENCGHRWTS